MPLTGVAAADPNLLLEEKAEFEEILAQLDQERKALIDGFDSLVNHFNEVWTGPIDWFQRTLFDRGEHQDQRGAIDRIREDLFGGDPESPYGRTRFTEDEGGEGGIVDLATKMVEHHTPVLSLFIMSSRWVTDVKSPISNMFAHLWQPEDGRNLAQWDDEARRAFDDIIDQQKDAVQAVEDMASFMSGWLADIATSNVEYITYLTSKLGELTSTIIKAVGRLTNTAGGSIIWDVAEVVGEAVSKAIDHLGEIARNIAEMIKRIIEANNKVLLDFSFFPDGKWPEAVTRA